MALQSGVNVITVTARDAAGNTGTDTIAVTYTPPQAIPPTISSARLLGKAFSLSVPTEIGHVYILERKGSVPDTTWIPIQTIIGNGGSITMADTGAASQSGFYRVRVE